MKHCKYFFIVYAIAILSSVGANAATTVTGLATPEYVKGALGSLNVTTATGSGNVVTAVTQTDGKIAVTKGSITSANNPTITITQNGTTKGTFTLNQSGAATIALTDNNTTYNIATSETAGLVKSGNDITVNSTTGAVTVNHAAKADTATSATSATTAGSATKATQDASGNVITSTYATKSELTTGLSNKQTTGNLVHAVADMTEGNRESTTMYPSMKVAQQIAMEVTSGDISGLQGDVEGLQTELDNLKGTVDANKTAAENAIKALDSSVTNANGAISTITITDGKITNVTRKSVSANDLATDAVIEAKIKDGAVTPAKTSGVVGYIPSGSATATTYAQIWVQ